MSQADKNILKNRKGLVTKEVNTLRRLIAEDEYDNVNERFPRLKEVFKDYEHAHKKVHDALEDEAAIAESDKSFEDTLEVYIGTLKMVKSWLKDNEPGQDKSSSNSTTSFGSEFVTMMNLPKVELEPFDGDPLKFHTFITVFDETVDKVVSDTKVKLTRLLQYTAGKAKEAIRFCINDKDGKGYENAREILRRRFGSNSLVTEKIATNLKKGKPIKNGDDLQQLADELYGSYMTLEQIKGLAEVNSQTCISDIAERLQPYIRNRWKRHAMEYKRNKDAYPDFQEFAKFIANEAEEATDPVYGQASYKSKPQQEIKSKNLSSFNSYAKQSSTTTSLQAKQSSFSSGKRSACVLCKADHRLWYCPDFKAMRPVDRLKLVSDNKLCENCLLPYHTAKDCKKQSFCSVPGCDKKHTKFIHVMASDSSSSTPVPTPAVTSAGASLDQGICMPVVAVTVNTRSTAALLDTGSSNSFCTRSLVEALNLTGRSVSYKLSTLNQTVEHESTNLVNLTVQSLDGQNMIIMRNVYVVDNLPVHSPLPCVSQYAHLHGLPLLSGDVNVEVLIGQDNSEALVPLEVEKGSPGEPFAVRTILGWVLNGPVGTTQYSKRVFSHFANVSVLENDVQRLWNIENEGLATDQTPYSVEEKRVVDLWDREVKIVDGHYELPIPWREGVDVPNNKPLAMSRLKSLRSSLDKRGLFSRYSEEVDKLLASGYAEPVAYDEVGDQCEGKIWYLPHQAVISDKKPGKLRPVFDCSARYKGESLNDKCYQGPDLNNHLLDVLLRFRRFDYAIVSDIQAMYYQVKIPLKDRDALRFLWYDECDRVITLRMSGHVFGGVWCASSSTYALRRTVFDSSDVDPKVESAILNSFYVDDFLHSVSTREEAVQIITGVKDLLAAGGFQLTKFVVNDDQLLQVIPESDRAVDVKDLNYDKSSKALGVRWNVTTDSFYFEVNISSSEHVHVTRRFMLSTLSSIFDPLGLVNPVVVRGKVLFQDATREKVGWDKPVTLAIQGQWTSWLKSLMGLKEVSVPRVLVHGKAQDNSAEIHYFSDSSERAYGCCAYLRTVNMYGEIRVILLMSKCRVAPLKPVTIPRLELQAAVLSVKMDVYLQEQLAIETTMQSYHWVDSEIVLKYIQNETRRFNIFVANRLSFIHTHTKPSQWRFIAGRENPADALTRGYTPEQVSSSNWLTGPEFLMSYKSDWDLDVTEGVLGPLSSDDPELKREKPVSCLATSVSDEPTGKLLSYFSDWYKLQRVVAWMLRLKTMLRSKQRATASTKLSLGEIKQAEIAILQYVQHREYPKEVKALMKGEPISSSSDLATLSPVLNGNHLLCVGGRLRNAPISQSSKCPVIVPHSHLVSRLIASQYHNIAHNGTEWVVSLIRQRFWITRVRKIVAQISRSCIQCKKLFAQPCSQKMSDLPAERLSPHEPPFTNIGIDCFGPFYVKLGRSEVKRYGCLFTCFTTRAVHLEKLNTMETDSFLNAFRRFMSRRGVPNKVWTDNGTNLLGGKLELDRSISGLDQDVLERFGLRRGISWQFNPPTASHMGGIWERMIRTVRKVFVSIVNVNVKLSDEVLDTLFCEVENIVNGRPITKVSDDINDSAPLTPNHLLLLRESPSIALGNFDKGDIYRRRWRSAQALSDQFWRQWLAQYLLDLQKRQKWTKQLKNVAIGDLVLICDESTPRGLWPMGLVVDVNESSDGLVRSVRVKTKSTTLVRPVTKIVLLEGAECPES